MNTIKQHKQFLFLLKLASITVFLGRAWQFLFWDAPYRALFWDQRIMQGIVNTVFQLSWKDWASSSMIDDGIQLSIQLTGVVYVISALMVLFVQKDKKWTQIPIWIGTGFLVFLAILQTKEKFFHFGQFFEHGSQIGAPILLLLYIKESLTKPSFVLLTKILISLTFFCHGLYAINYYPRPGIFVDLLLNTFHVSETFAHQFIWVIGIIDILIVPLLFFPKTVKIALWYTAIWGIVTALSRVYANLYWDFALQSLHQSLHTSIYRLTHGLLPLALLVFTKKRS